MSAKFAQQSYPADFVILGPAIPQSPTSDIEKTSEFFELILNFVENIEALFAEFKANDARFAYELIKQTFSDRR